MQSSASRRGSWRGKYRELYSTLCNDLHVKSVLKKKIEIESLKQKTDIRLPRIGQGGINWETRTDTYTLLYIKQ